LLPYASTPYETFCALGKTVALTRDVQFIPFVLVATVIVLPVLPSATATHKPFPEPSWPYSIPEPAEPKPQAPLPVQLIPSELVAMMLPLPEPTATHKLLPELSLPKATSLISLLKIIQLGLPELLRCVHVIPSLLDTITPLSD